PIRCRPTRPLLGYSGSITAINRAHGTMRSISARNFSRRVRFFFIAYSALAKLRWDMVGLGCDSVRSRMQVSCRAWRIDHESDVLALLRFAALPAKHCSAVHAPRFGAVPHEPTAR